MFSRALLAAAAALLTVAACAPSESDDSVADEQDLVAKGIQAKGSDPCTATFVFLQKDAYKSTGKSSDFWPPHTTTVLDVTCQTAKGEQHIAPFQENHGTKPDAKDAQGKDVLTRIDMDRQVVTTEAPWSEMKKLVTSFSSCACDPSGFLGLDTIDSESQEIVAKLTEILTCPDPAEKILGALQAKQFAEAKAMAARCKVKDGVPAEELAKTALAIEGEVQSIYREHHVCNNDALLQVDLFQRFRDHRDARVCDPHDKALCSGPKLFFSPKREVR